MNIYLMIIISLIFVILILSFIIYKGKNSNDNIDEIKAHIDNSSQLLEKIQNINGENLNNSLQRMERQLSERDMANEKRLEYIRNTVAKSLEYMDKQMSDRDLSNEQKLESIRVSVRESLSDINKQMSSRASESEQKLEFLRDSVTKTLKNMDEQMGNRASINEQKLDKIKETVEANLNKMTKENNAQLEKMRETVDEKLENTLNQRISQSFKIVNERLEQVYKGLGEMQNLATGVGDLKKVLSNVKTRGILGEIQLGNILSEILSPSQYEENVAVKPGATERVEFAVKMPGNGEDSVYLPIDAKFPADTYEKLLDAYDIGDKALILEATRKLESRIKAEAKDIRDKYIEPPYTTEFAIIFLPVEGLYAEVIRLGLVEKLQREYNIVIAGPTTMAAILNSIQMGFRTLAIQKRTGEVWKVLSGVKKEFETFGGVLEKAKRHMNQVNDDLDKLIGTRTRQIQRRLKDVTLLEVDEDEKPLLEEGE